MKQMIKVVETKNGSLRFYTADKNGKIVAVKTHDAFIAVLRDEAHFVDSFKTETAFITVFVNGTVAVDAKSDKVNFSNRMRVQTVYDAKIIDGIARATGKFFDNGNGTLGAGRWGNDGDRMFPITNATPAAKAYVACNNYSKEEILKETGENPDCFDEFDDLVDWALGFSMVDDFFYDLYDFLSEA